MTRSHALPSHAHHHLPRPTRLLSLGLVALALATLAVAVARPAVASTTESAFVSRINSARAAAGLPALSVSGDLTSYARSHSAAMARRGSLFHTSSWSSICCWREIAENVGMGGSVSVISSMFMSSSAHRANILDRSMRQVGVGVVSSGGYLWVTEIFRDPTGSSPPVTTTRHTVTRPSTSPASVRSGPRPASRSLPRVDPVRAALARLEAIAARARGTGDPVAQATAWSAAMRALVPSG